MSKQIDIRLWLSEKLERTLASLFGTKCPNCGSRDTRYSQFTRGWNELCNHAIGDSGLFCHSCHTITWDRPLDEYRKQLPSWCTAYERD